MTDSMESLNTDGGEFYRAALKRLIAADIPYLVGGAYALEVHTGIVRRTKDFDIFMRKEDVPRALKLLKQAGYRTELTFPHWIGKVFSGDEFIDIIFSSGNGACPVDERWFEHAVRGKVLGMEMLLCPAEESIWQKSYILERDRCDVADVAHLLRHCGKRLDWQRLVARFGDNWRVLLAQLILFEFIYPGHRDEVPGWVMEQLLARRASEGAAPASQSKTCNGTLISATQYLRDVDHEGYEDVRLEPTGNISAEDIAIWTANFMQPKSH
jgi:hypothetical protein